MKKIISVLFVLLFSTLFIFAQPAAETTEKTTRIFVDSVNREVEIPVNIEKVAPSGVVASMFLITFAPEKMCTISGRITGDALKYLPEKVSTLPETGQMYGGKATLNLEELLNSGAQLVIDLGDKKNGIEDDLNALQEKIGIPVIFIEADLNHMAKAFRMLGDIFNNEERGEELAKLVEETVSMAKENSAKVKDEDRISVLYTSGPTGLNTNAKGSTQAQVLDIVGVENAIVVDKVSNKGGGNVVNMEEVILANPDMILFSANSIYDTVKDDPAWNGLDAIKNGKYYQIPSLPYNWLSGPPSLNMILGVWWLGNLAYPEIYNYDMVEKTKELYSTLWSYNMSDSEAKTLLNY